MSTNEGDKGRGTPGVTNADLSKPQVTDKEKLEAELDARLKEKSKQVAQLEEVAKNLTKTVRTARHDSKIFEEPTPVSPVEKTDIDDYASSSREEFNKILNERLTQEKQSDRIRMYNRVANRFINEHNEFDPENDIGGELQAKFIQRAKGTFLGETEFETVETLEFILNGLISSQTKNNDNKPMELGDISSNVKKPKEENPWLTKKLNKWEAEAAKRYPGGEVTYRKKMAELSKE